MTANNINDFLDAQDIAPTSKNTYRAALYQFWKYTKKTNAESINKKTILQFKQYLDAKGLSSSTRFSYIMVLRQYYKWAFHENVYDNAAFGVKAVQRDSKKHKKDALSIEQVRKVLAGISTVSIEGKRNYAIVNLLVRTGCRLIEIVRANCEDIEKRAGKFILWVRGKGKSEKNDYVILSDEILKPIKKYHKARGTYADQEPLFTSLSDRNYGQRLTVYSISRMVKYYLREAGIDSYRITAHSLRHTFGILCMKSGMSLWEVQSAMRHTTSSTTQIYLADIEDEMRLAGAPEKKVNDLIDG